MKSIIPPVPYILAQERYIYQQLRVALRMSQAYTVEESNRLYSTLVYKHRLTSKLVEFHEVMCLEGCIILKTRIGRI